MKTAVKLVLTITVAILLYGQSQVRAEIYTFVDAQGKRIYTNVPTSSKSQLYRSEGVTISKPTTHPWSNVSSGVRQRYSARNGKNSTEFDQHIQQSGWRHDVDPLLIKAIIKAESGFNCDAKSNKGALGLMQLMPGTAKDLRVANPLDPRANIDGGTRYFRAMLDTFHGNIPLSLAAYNVGPNLVKQTNTVPQIPETMEYVQRVLHHYKGYKGYAGYR